MADGYNPLDDPEFQQASVDDKRAYLMHVDPEFSKASPEEQSSYVNHIQTKILTAGVTDPAQNATIDKMQREGSKPQMFSEGGFIQRGLGALGVPTTWSELQSQVPQSWGDVGKSFAKTAAIPFANALEGPTKAAWEAGKGAIREGAEAGTNIAEGGRFWPNAGKALSGAVEHGIEALPFSGPGSAQVGRDISTGNWGGAAGGALGTLLPFAVPAVGEGVAKGFRAVAPSAMESGIGTTARGRLYNKAPGEAFLKETEGAGLGKTTETADARLANLGQGIVQGYQAKAGSPVSARPAIDVIDKYIARQNVAGVDMRSDLRASLEQTKAILQQLPANITPEELWRIKTLYGDMINFSSEQPAVRALGKRIQNELYGALDKELDRVAPEVSPLNDRFSSLKEGYRTAEKVSRGEEIPQAVLDRIGRRTGGAAVGMYELLSGNPLGAAAAIVGPEVAATPGVRIGLARGLWKLGGGEKLPPVSLRPPPAPPAPPPPPLPLAGINIQGGGPQPTNVGAPIGGMPPVPTGPTTPPAFGGGGLRTPAPPALPPTASGNMGFNAIAPGGPPISGFGGGIPTATGFGAPPTAYPPIEPVTATAQPPQPTPVAPVETPKAVGKVVAEEPVVPKVTKATGKRTKTAPVVPPEPAPMSTAPPPATVQPAAPLVQEKGPMPTAKVEPPPPPPPEAPPMVPKAGEPEPRPPVAPAGEADEISTGDKNLDKYLRDRGMSPEMAPVDRLPDSEMKKYPITKAILDYEKETGTRYKQVPVEEAPKPVSEKPETTPTEKGNTDMRETPTEAPKKPTGPYVPGPDPIKQDLRVDKATRIEVNELRSRHPDLSREEALDIIREVRQPAKAEAETPAPTVEKPPEPAAAPPKEAAAETPAPAPVAESPAKSPATIKLDDGRVFPSYEGKPLSWSLDLTDSDRTAGYPKLRAVIRAMQEERPEQLERERSELLKGSFDQTFGKNAKEIQKIIKEETGRDTPETIFDKFPEKEAAPAAPVSEKSESAELKEIRERGTAHKGNVGVKVVVHPLDDNAFGVETTVDGDRRYPTEPPMTMEQAQEFAAKQLDNPRPTNYQPTEKAAVAPEVKPPKPLGPISPTDFADDMVRQGVDRKTSWSKWIQKTNLNPGMDAKDWYKIYDASKRIGPAPTPEIASSKPTSKPPISTTEAPPRPITAGKAEPATTIKATPTEEAQVLSARGKPSSKTGLTKAQASFLGDKLREAAKDLPLNSLSDGTRVLAKSKAGSEWEGTIRGEPTIERSGPSKGEKKYSVVPVNKKALGGEPQSIFASNIRSKEGAIIEVPGDGTFKVPSVQSANRLIKKIGEAKKPPMPPV